MDQNQKKGAECKDIGNKPSILILQRFKQNTNCFIHQFYFNFIEFFKVNLQDTLLTFDYSIFGRMSSSFKKLVLRDFLNFANGLLVLSNSLQISTSAIMRVYDGAKLA